MSDIAPSGILIIDKHAGVTSSDVVVRLRRLMGTRQIGHTGTLDPMATGVLPVLVGRAVKASDFLTAENKRYIAEMRLGVETDTEDTTGNVTRTSTDLPDEAAVRTVCATHFCGEIMQIPPMVSALKVGGRKLVDLAREGVTVERQPRPITVHALGVERLEDDLYRLDVACSKGTYIRTLCADIGRMLGCGAAMAALRRVESGPFSLAQAVTLSELEEMTAAERAARLLPLESYFADLPAVVLPDFYARLARNGCEIYQKKIHTALPDGTLVRMCDSAGFFALGRVRDDFADGSAIKAVKLFSLE